MTVLHLIKGLGRGGAEMLLLETLQFHSTENFKFKTIYFLPHKNQLVGELSKKSDVELMTARNPLTMLMRILRLVKKITESNVSLIHCHLPWSGIVGRIAGRIAGVPVIYTEHNLQERYHWLTRLMNLLTIGMNTKVLAVSNNVGESIRKNKSPHFPVKIIHNGVDTCRFRKNGRVSAETVIDGGSSKAGLTIGNVAVFTPKKRLDVWLRVASDILRSFPETHFLLVGDGPERKRLEQLAKHLGIQRSVHFTGLQREIKPLLEKMDIFLMTSEFEGLPVALLEAMSMEKAVSVTDAGGIKEVVNYHNGMIAEPGDYELILKNTLKLLKNEQLRLQLGELARKTVIEKFDLQRMVKELESVYLETINDYKKSHT